MKFGYLTDKKIINTVLLCHECDLVIHPKENIRLNHTLNCPRCNSCVVCKNNFSPAHSLALVLTGLILYLPANILPIISASFFGNVQTASVLDCAIALLHNDYPILAVLFFLLMPVFPLLLMTSALISLMTAIIPHIPKSLGCRFLALYQLLCPWLMLDIFFLGVFVSFVKLRDFLFVEIHSLGLLCFVFLMVVEIMLVRSIPVKELWLSVVSRKAS